MLLELIGEFDVVSGEVVVSDPCYSLGTWCAGDLKAVNGRCPPLPHAPYFALGALPTQPTSPREKAL